MEPSRLVDSITSDFIKFSNAYKPKSETKTIIVYVEGYEDIPFWENIFQKYETTKFVFNVKCATQKGKQGALEKAGTVLKLGLGHYLIAGVDSDYDYLLQGNTDQSKMVCENGFVFHTYSYSIENLRCYSKSLKSVCVYATKHDKTVIDFV